MKNFIYLTVLLLTCQVGFAQLSNTAILENVLDENTKFGRFVNSRGESGSVKDAYLFDDTNGKVEIFTREGKAYSFKDVNFNLSKQELSVPLDGGKSFTFNNADIRYFQKGNRKFVFIPGQSKPLHEIVFKGEKGSLFKKFDLELKQAMTNPLTNEITKPAYYTKEEVLVLRRDNQVFELPSKKKRFLEAFGDDSSKIAKYIKSNNLSLKNSNDIIKVVEYYNTI
ncbi:hypothetical protein [Mangrovimonas sp. ST2L15]|uniref:hypothetical protein n=1 Tax=Mangrovimonas sp. ST2L15 TaxID=1645916 RepID=UPI0006B5E7EB|nr:hypothetical protein [Mangrovimonas sp. ST2L15]